MRDWYKNYLNERIEKKASLQQGVMISIISLLSATSAWFEAGQIRNFLDQRNIPHEQFANTVNEINDSSKSFDDIDKSDVVLAKQHIDYETEDTEVEVAREDLPPFDTIARTIYDEAQGEGAEGMRMVADVILNRSNGTPNSMKQVSLKPWQFSGWNKGTMLPEGNGDSWEISKNLAKDILSPNAQAELGDYTNFVNPRVVLQDHNMNIPPITEPNDILSIPEPYLQHLPTFMFKPIEVDQGQGSWKHVYPKRRNNIRTDFTILGRHVAYK